MVVERKTSKSSVGFHPQKPWLRSQTQRSEPTQPISEDSHVLQDSPATIIEQASPQIVSTSDNNTTAKKRGRGPTTNRNAKKRKEGSKGEVQISKRLGRAVGGEALKEFVTEMGVVLRQYAPLNVHKWAQVPTHYKDKMWDDLLEKYNGLDGFRNEVMSNLNHLYRNWRHRKHLHYKQFETDAERLQNCPNDLSESAWASLVEYFGSESFQRMSERNKSNRANQETSSICGRKSFASILHDMRDPTTEVDPDLSEYWKATHQRKSNGTWCSAQAENALEKIEQVSQSQQELGAPPLSIEEHLTQSLGGRSGHLRGLGRGPKPLTTRNLTIKASTEYFDKQITVLKEELHQSRVENEEREQRFKKEIEEIGGKIQAKLQTEFSEQLKIIVGLYGVPPAPPPSSSGGVPATPSRRTESN